MKRIDINTPSPGNPDHRWRPWGMSGWLIRWFIFLAIMVPLCMVLSELEGCSRIDILPDAELWNIPTEESGELSIPDYPDINDPLNQLPEQWRDMPELDDGSSPYDINIPDPGEYLPKPSDNHIKETPKDEYVPNPENNYRRISANTINVILEDGTRQEVFKQFSEGFKKAYPQDDYKIGFYSQASGLIQLIVPGSAREEVMRRLPSQIRDVKFKVFYEERFSSTATPPSHNDPALSDKNKSWYLRPIQAYEAWDITKGNKDVTVAIIDSYIDISHPELRDRIRDPYSVERQSANVLPPSGTSYSFNPPQHEEIFHGTHVAATALGALDNGQGGAGIAPGCTLMPISIGGNISSMKVLEAILYAINKGADVINLSIGTYYSDEAQQCSVEDQLQYSRQEGKYSEDVWNYVFDLANRKNCTIVWAGGNQNLITGMDEMKRNPTTVRVSAVDHNLRRAEFSNYGRYDNRGVNFSDISAPGVDIFSAGPVNNYGYCDGTSMAAPIVTGAIALMKSINPNISNKRIIEILNATSRKLPAADHAGGVIQIADALKMVKGDAANFDEISRDNNLLKGDWVTTEQLTVVDENENPTGSMTHIILHFDSPSRGTIIYKEDTGKNYTAPFVSKISANALEVRMTSEAKCKDGSAPFEKITIKGHRGKDGLLELTNPHSGANFYMMRISK